MTTRLLDIRPDEFASLDGKDLIEAVRASEGRALASEIIAPAPSLLKDVSNAELAAAMGADILLFNMLDADKPAVDAFETSETSPLEAIARRVGRFIGVNLEPIGEAEMLESRLDVPKGRQATVKNARALHQQGVQLLVLTGNPKTGVTNEAIVARTKEIKDALGGRVAIAAGKMHSAGIKGETARDILTPEDVAAFAEAGADLVLFPAPGTVPGIGEARARELVEAIHKKGRLAMSAIGTSQEGADKETIRRIALMSKAAGTDLHHIGDAGYPGLAVPENILHYSITIRGVRHTYRRMAMR